MFESIRMFAFEPRSICRSTIHRLPLLFILFLVFTSSSADKDKRRDKKDGYLTEYACEGKSVHIKCKKPGTVISVIRANYGRYSIATCNDQGILHWKVDCTSHKTLYVIQNRCNNKIDCSIEASSNLFGDACPGTPKYLEAQYTCISYNTEHLSNSTNNAGSLSNDPFGFSHSIDSKSNQPGRNNSSRTSSIPKIPGNPFHPNAGKSNSFFSTLSTTTEALPKIIVPNLPIQNTQLTQPTINPIKSTSTMAMNTVNSITSSTTTTTTTQSTPNRGESNENDTNRDESSHVEHSKSLTVNKTKEDNVFGNQTVSVQNTNFNKVFNELNHNSINNVQNEQTRTPASSSPFVKSSPEHKQLHQSTNTKSTPIVQSSNDLDSRNPALTKRSMLHRTQNTALSIFLTISIVISIGVLCLTFIIFIFSRPSSKRTINYMNISLALICMQIILLIATNKRNINYSNLFSSQQQINILSVPSLLAISLYYLLQVLFNLLLIESVRIYCNYLLNKRTLKSRGYIYYSGADQQIEASLLNYIRWSRSAYLTYGLAYLVPVLSCSSILLFVEDSLKFFISSLLLIEPPVLNLSNQVPPPSISNQTPEDNYPQLGLLVLCFAFTYFVLFIAILLIFIAAKGCWRLQQQQRDCMLSKLNDSHKFGSTSTYSNALSTANYNQLTLNSFKQNGTSGPQIPQISTLSTINNIDNSLCSAQTEPNYLMTSYTKRAAMKLLIIVLIGQTFSWTFWLALCHLNSRLNVHLDLFNEFDQQEHSSLSAILQILIAVFACLNIAQSFFVMASAFQKNHKINSSSIDSTDRNLFSSKMHFGLKCLPICVRKTGASPLPLIGNNQLNNSALNSASSSIQQSQLMIQPNSNTGQQPVYFYSLDPNQLNTVNQLNNQSTQLSGQAIVQPPSPIIKLNNTNFHTMMMNRNSNNYLSRDVNTMCRQPTKHNDYLLATSAANNRILNSKSQHSLVPFLIQQQQNRPQSYASSQQRFSIQEVNPYAPPVLIDDHRINEQLIKENLLNNHQINNEQSDYEEVMPANFDYLNSNIVQPGQQQSNNILLNAANSAAIMNRNSQATLRMLNNGGNKNSVTNSSRTNSTNSDNQNSFNNLQQFIPNYTNGQSNLQQNNQQFESEQDIYESVESPCIYTRSPIYYSEGNRG